MGKVEKVEPGKVLAPKPDKLFGFRHVQIALLFFCTGIAYMTRVSMSVAIVAMTTENLYGYPVFEWKKSVQDTILSSFFWGYIVLQVPAGILSARFGGKRLLSISMLINSIVNLLVPFAAIGGDWVAVCVCRVVLGLAQGLLYPSIHGLLGKWCPRTERGRLVTFVYNGSQVGTVVELILAGILSASSWGWPSVYYTVGVACLVWVIMWMIFGASSPAESKFISSEEKLYIEANTGGNVTEAGIKVRTPWTKVFSTLSFWSIFVAHCGQSFGFWTLLTEIPSYMKNVYGVDIKSNGILSALPYMTMYLLAAVFSMTADYLTNKQILTATCSRKLFNTIAFWGPAASLLILSYLPSNNVPLAVAFLALTVGLNGAHYLGFMLAHIDIAPNFASTLMGITNGASNIFSIMAPLSVSLVIQDETMASEWRKVFFIAIGFFFLGNLFFLLFFKASVVSWNDVSSLNSSIELGTPKKPNSLEATENDIKIEQKTKKC